MTEIKTAHTKATTTQGHQLNNKHRHEGGARTTPKDVVKCKTCGCLHRGQCWVEGEQKREQGLALLKEAEGILPTKKKNKPFASEIKTLETTVVVNKDQNECPVSQAESVPTCVYHQGYITSESIAHRQWNNILTHNAILDLKFVPDTEGVVVDSGAMIDIVKGIKDEGKCV